MVSDQTANGFEGETPINPYSLLEAVNRSSDTANTAWLIFLAIMAYLMIAVAGVTHQDLLIEKPVSLPILQVDILQTQFFQFAPIILVLLHLGIVAQLALLARKTLEFDYSVRLLEMTDRRTHPLRLELHNFFFVQAIAGPHRSLIIGGFLHAMSWLTLVILPVVLILYIQVVFLPYHDAIVTWTHRIALVFDVAILMLIGVFLSRAEPSFFAAFWRTASTHPIAVFVTAIVLSVVTLFSFFVATIPDETLDRMARRVLGDRVATQAGPERSYRGSFITPFWSLSSDGALFGIFQRNLVVTDTDLVVDKDVTPGEPTLNLRGRDLRYAKLDRSDLHQADLTGANLDHASLDGTDLRGAWMQCADLNELLLSEDRNLAVCTSARDANFSRGLLSNAHLVGLDLRGAKFESANLRRANLAYAILTGTNFASARLDEADITGGVQAQGANFLVASLQGADMTGAQLQNADFSSASMQGAILNYAHLQAAVLRDAGLEGATLQQVKLFGADMTGAKIHGADLRWAEAWITDPPELDAQGLVDVSSLSVSAPNESAFAAMRLAINRITKPRLRRQVSEALQPLMTTATLDAWSGSVMQRAWADMQSASYNATDADEAYRRRLTDYLITLMCRPLYANGAVAVGVARRAQALQFRGDLGAVYDRLAGGNCPAAKTITPALLQDLSSAADIARE